MSTPRVDFFALNAWKRHNWLQLRRVLGMLALAAVFLWRYGQGAHFGMAYVAAGVFVAWVAFITVRRRLPLAATATAASVLGVTIFFVAWRFETYDVYEPYAPGGGFTTTYRSWDRTPVYQDMRIDGDLWAFGPLTPSGKYHGKWTIYDWSGKRTKTISTVWYWYGEVVSEGEYASRAK